MFLRERSAAVMGHRFEACNSFCVVRFLGADGEVLAVDTAERGGGVGDEEEDTLGDHHLGDEDNGDGGRKKNDDGNIGNMGTRMMMGDGEGGSKSRRGEGAGETAPASPSRESFRGQWSSSQSPKKGTLSFSMASANGVRSSLSTRSGFSVPACSRMCATSAGSLAKKEAPWRATQ